MSDHRRHYLFNTIYITYLVNLTSLPYNQSSARREMTTPALKTKGCNKGLPSLGSCAPQGVATDAYASMVE